MQFAWLDVFGGRWLLLDSNLKYPARSWADEGVALAELREEGWTIKPHLKRFPKRMRSSRRSYGYAMMRAVH